MIEIENLTVRFGGVRGLNELTATLDVPITALVGPNGAGKTTLLNVLSGFVHPTTGKVRVDGQEILRLAPYRRAGFGIRRTFQTEQVVENLSVWDHAAAILDNVPYGGRSRDELIRAALDFVGLTPQADALGAVAGVPRLIMMDEPGAGLSESESEHLRQVILGIPAFCGAQVLLVDHDVDLVSATCAATLVLDFGSKIAYGPTQQVLNDPAVRAAYLGTTEGEAA
jgi:ABC-type branched-subunit amino acid transport system ATPase component